MHIYFKLFKNFIRLFEKDRLSIRNQEIVPGFNSDFKYFFHLCFSSHLSVQHVGHLRATSHHREPLPPRVSKIVVDLILSRTSDWTVPRRPAATCTCKYSTWSFRTGFPATECVDIRRVFLPREPDAVFISDGLIEISRSSLLTSSRYEVWPFSHEIKTATCMHFIMDG